MVKKPLELYGNLEFVGQDAEGKIHLLIRKNTSPMKTREIIKDIKTLEKKDVRLTLILLRWNNRWNKHVDSEIY